MKNLTEIVAQNCDCTNEQANEFINDEVKNLRELAEKDDLRYSDLQFACENLGCDFDYIETLMGKVIGYF